MPSKAAASAPTRRSLLLTGLAAGAALTVTGLTSGRAFALTTDEASQLIDRVIGDINRVINSGKSEAQMFPEFERIFSRYADVPVIARSVLGVAARQASQAQLNAFTQAFQGYIARKYGRRFREFIGGEIKVNEARQVKTFYEVKTTALLRGQSPVEVVFLVSDRSGKDKFFNIFIEGVNMLASERTEIGAMLDKRRGDIGALTRDLRSAG
ncbi:MlaC/ttg2D family ABC transporter substrate-binding protein [Rhodovulum sulfidophilum]|uniref:ABC transporter substrate-binding protein n=1 Tax=Rhodovulum sulfidophilum TaxID=35806 RepID=A0ABS1RMW8_RHOSU|nr:ABC transporter substrate-binding protein [Rhodovulum sulfidophilum]MBL3607391.1 ABC transporter substrate-binding protein [Rhodovulum sulfidophilum]MCE8459030.1 ABC transporter substrate-binding protein [Rhodovulum sulfidophilum]OLS53444.1 ABC transporter [Rhodovulum sulfidophilum]